MILLKEFNKNKPLILIHVPKTAGSTVKDIYKSWFGEKLLFHYHSGSDDGGFPEKYNLMAGDKGDPLFVYGHFNRSKKFGIEHYYPEVDQFISILRDPFEMAVSGFFYVKKINPTKWREQLKLPKGGLREYLNVMNSGLLNFFPYEVTIDNYEEMIETKFIEIGVTELLDESLQRISKKLGCYYVSNSLKWLNVSLRDQNVPYELKSQFIERHKLEYQVYNFVLNKYH